MQNNQVEPKASLQRKHNGKPPNRRAIGPVVDLESHVADEWWRFIFNHTYLKTDADVIDDPQITSREVDLLQEILNLETDAHILDLCCGQGRHTLELRQRGFANIQGLDRSRYLINRARQSAKQRSLQIRFREGDARKLPFQKDEFDTVLILGNSFGYFSTIEDDERVLGEVHRVLKPSGTILLDVTDGEYMRSHFQARSWEWIDKNRLVCRERSLSKDQQRLISREIVIHNDQGTTVDQFYAERLYTQEILIDLLEKSGFLDVTVHTKVKGESTREQDLGMMSHRIVVSARAHKLWDPALLGDEPETRNITVITGDPSIKDPLKPSAQFDEDDFYTINQMKSALGQLPDSKYSVSYLDSHHTLIEDLLRNRPDLVLNLCDEGYLNDPHKELHIPALLELLQIPYTGGTPQCLAACYDKALVRSAAREMNIPVPAGYVIDVDDNAYHLPSSFPVIIKPVMGDSSYGIYASNVLHDATMLGDAIGEFLKRYRQPVLVEEFLTGSDLTVGIIGNPPDDYTVLPIGVTDYSGLPAELPPICGYESKWHHDSPYWTSLKFVPAQLPEQTQQRIIEWSLQLMTRFECRDYVRLDWRCNAKGEPKLLEINPNPGWCWDGHLKLMAEFQDISYPNMLSMIIAAAEARYRMTTTLASKPTQHRNGPRTTQPAEV